MNPTCFVSSLVCWCCDDVGNVSLTQYQSLSETPFTPCISICPEWCDHMWSVLSTGLNAPQCVLKSEREPMTQTTFAGGLDTSPHSSFKCMLRAFEGRLASSTDILQFHSESKVFLLFSVLIHWLICGHCHNIDTDHHIMIRMIIFLPGRSSTCWFTQHHLAVLSLSLFWSLTWADTQTNKLCLIRRPHPLDAALDSPYSKASLNAADNEFLQPWATEDPSWSSLSHDTLRFSD